MMITEDGAEAAYDLEGWIIVLDAEFMIAEDKTDLGFPRRAMTKM